MQPRLIWLFVFILLFGSGCRGPIPQASIPTASIQLVSSDDTVTVTDVRIPSEAAGGLLYYRAIVPKAAPGERLPVLYLLHGGMGDPNDMQQHTNAVKQAIAQRLIIITPNAGLSWYTNAKHRQNERWEDATVYDLVRDVDSRFPVLAGREHRGLAGVSMGGYGAVKLALKHPELYGFAAMMGGSLDITRRWPNVLNPGQTWDTWMIFGFRPATERDEDVFDLLDHMASPQAVKWFASCGSEDSMCTGDTEFVRQLRQRGVVAKTAMTTGQHNWDTWDKTFPALFKTAGESLH